MSERDLLSSDQIFPVCIINPDQQEMTQYTYTTVLAVVSV